LPQNISLLTETFATECSENVKESIALLKIIFNVNLILEIALSDIVYPLLYHLFITCIFIYLKYFLSISAKRSSVVLSQQPPLIISAPLMPDDDEEADESKR